MTQKYNLNQVSWRSRRGMLELDLILEPFVAEAFEGLAVEDQDRFVKMLEGEDQDMFRWFLKAEQPTDPDLAIIVGIILQHNAQRRRQV